MEVGTYGRSRDKSESGVPNKLSIDHLKIHATVCIWALQDLI